MCLGFKPCCWNTPCILSDTCARMEQDYPAYRSAASRPYGMYAVQQTHEVECYSVTEFMHMQLGEERSTELVFRQYCDTLRQHPIIRYIAY